jgi:hypothetical protein
LGLLKSNLYLKDLFNMLESSVDTIMEKELLSFFIRLAKLGGFPVFVGIKVTVVLFWFVQAGRFIIVVSPK